MINVDGLILAAGRSSRMEGLNKVHAVLHDKTLLQHVIDRLLPQVSRILINADPQIFDEAPYPVIEDQLRHFRGPLTGLYSALVSDHLSDADYLMMTPCDGPFIPSNLVSELYNLIVNNDSDIACVRYQGFAQPTFSVWNKRVKGAVERSLLGDNNGGFKPLLDSLNTVYLDWPEQALNPFYNINSREDLARAELLKCQ